MQVTFMRAIESRADGSLCLRITLVPCNEFMKLLFQLWESFIKDSILRGLKLY